MSTQPITGGCHCGALRVSAWLTQVAATYAPRACDCDFCGMHGAAYLSDPAGRLEILVHAKNALRRYRQGAGIAEFLFCGACGVLVGVIHEDGGVRRGAANARVLDAGFADAGTVSPKRLSADDKAARWRELWFADVRIRQGDG